MDVSVIVPLSGGHPAALRVLTALAELPDDPPHEVVLVDDAAPDLGGLLARVEGDATVVRRPRRGGVLAAARDGLAAARGARIVLLAEGAELTALRPLVDALDDAGVAAATAGPPAAAGAIAFRAADLAEVPAGLPDAAALAAIALALAPRGRVVEAAPAPRVAGTAAARATGGYGADPELTIVIPTLDAAGDRLRACVRAFQAHTDATHEIVVVDNGAPPQGFTAPVNAGLRAGRGRYLVVCNDDVEVLPGWWSPLRAALDAGAAVVFPFTEDGAMRADFAAWCFALTRATLEEHAVAPGEFLHPELKVWYQDTDLLQRLRLAGTPPRLVEAARIRHGLSETVGTADPSLRAWIDTQIRADKARFEALHGTNVQGAAR